MKVTLEKDYGADADGGRGINVYKCELDNSLEEREEIAGIIAGSLLKDGEVNLYSYEVELNYSDDGCDVDCKFTVSPFDYIDLIVDMVLNSGEGKEEALEYLSQESEVAYEG